MPPGVEHGPQGVAGLGIAEPEPKPEHLERIDFGTAQGILLFKRRERFPTNLGKRAGASR
ncbi:MAG: hypothetical protein LH606_18500 [Cytophagaceae bacterium]|nr:hypothetical protein [Cytophagaceae bacterium]